MAYQLVSSWLLVYFFIFLNIFWIAESAYMQVPPKPVEVPAFIGGLGPHEWNYKCRQALGPYSDSVHVEILGDCTRYKCIRLPNADILLKTIICPPVPKHLKRICSRMMDKSPIHHYPECCPVRLCLVEIMWNQLEDGMSLKDKTNGELDTQRKSHLAHEYETCAIDEE